MIDFNTSNMTAAELQALARQLEIEAIKKAEAERKAELQARRAKAAAEAKQHYDRMFTEIGQPIAGLNETQHAIVYSAAYEEGHASGYSEVEMHYGDFAEMARKILDAN